MDKVVYVVFDNLALSYATQNLLAFVTSIVVVIHWLACLWRSVAEFEIILEAENTWYNASGMDASAPVQPRLS